MINKQEINVSRLSEAIIRHRKAASLTVREAAMQLVDVSSSTISRIERGALPDLNTYIRICNWLKISPTYFIDNNDYVASSKGLKIDDILLFLKNDSLLNREISNSLVTLIEMAYKEARYNIS